MSSGTFPSVLKTGIVSRVYKKGNPQQFDNYRPISTLSIFSKLFEKRIYKRIYSFLIAQETQTNQKIPHNHGFEQFQEIPIFSARIWLWRLGVWNSENPQKLTHRVVLTTQLLTRNKNFLNISADTPLRLSEQLYLYT